MIKDMPVFKSDKETAEFWDKTDAAPYMEGGEIGEFTWEPVEDRCNYCSSKMEEIVKDIDFLEGRITFHNIKKYHCPNCGREKLAKEFREEIPLITKELVEIALQI